MNIFRRCLAMFLAICLLAGGMPMTAWAEEAESAEPPATTEAPAETTGEDTPMPRAGTAIGHMDTKPADGTTTGEPFPENTAGSFSFRIPALVTLSDGTLVAAADARWNTTYDGGGLDTIVARSSDNGANWSYTFANYLGDNGNAYNGNSTAFIDPSLAVTADDTIYMLVDLYPYGVALNGGKDIAPQETVGFNDAGQLRLSGDNHGSYGYYLNGGKIYTSTGDEVAGYTVDEYFNIYQNGNYVSNLFFADSPYKVVRTGYLYLTKSTDKGATWSAPTLLNLKTASEQVCLVGPGRGLVTQNGTIIFPVYSYAGESAKYTGLIYSTDNGVNWQRSVKLSTSGTTIPNITSEATMVELGNGKIRTFFRNDNATLCYSDFNLTNGTWATCINTGVACNSDTELSAIVYSKQVEHDGKLKDVVLVSCPAGPNAAGSDNNNGAYRSSGKIFAGLIDPVTYEMTWLDKSVAVTPVATGVFGGSIYAADQGFFAYSCLTEQKDNGSVSILYEDSQCGWGAAADGSNYYTMAFKTYTESDLETALGVTFADETTPDVGGDGDEDEPEEVIVNVTLKVGQSQTYTEASGSYSTATTNPDANIVTMTVQGNGQTGEATYTVASEIKSGAQYLITTGNSIITGNTSTGYNGSWSGAQGLLMTADTTNQEQYLWTITEVTGGYTVKNANGQYLNIAAANNNITLSATPVVLSVIDNGSTFTIHNNEYCLNNFGGSNVFASCWQGTTDTNAAWTLKEYSPAVAASTEVTFIGKNIGTTTAVVGNTTYNIAVTAQNVIDVELKVGESKRYTDNTGNYQENENNIAPDDKIATMQVVGTGSTVSYTSMDYTSITYDSLLNVDSNDWVPTKYGYKVDGTIHRLYAKRVTETEICYFGLAYSSTENENSIDVVLINIDNKQMYMTAGQTSTTIFAEDWGTVNKAELYLRSETAGANETTITFEGVAPGNTVAVVGNTQYNITVLSEERTVDIELEVGESFTYTDTTGSYTAEDEIKQRPDGAYANMAIQGASVDTRTSVTAIESGKRYLIVNINSQEILTDNETTVSGKWGGRAGLATIPENSTNNLEWWTITESGGKYTLSQNGKYLAIAGFVAYMYDTETLLTLTYTDQGWTIYDDTTWKALGHDKANYYLSDSVGDNYSGSAQGTSSTGNAAMYWDIIEIPHTDVTFTGVAPGETTARVGNTTYNITVVDQEVDDEVENTQTDGWTVDPEIQTQRITSATVENESYTVETWKAYEEALTAARNKLAEVTSTVYPSEQDAQAALAALAAQMDTLENAKDALVVGKNITIRYWRLGGIVEEETIGVPQNAVTYDLPATRTFNGKNYNVSPSQLTVAGSATQFDVHLLQEYNASSGIIGHNDIDGTKLEGKPVTDMTFTPGMAYNLDLADILADGQSVEWSSVDAAVAEVNASTGEVQAVGVGNTTITATIKDRQGGIVKTYSVPITVLPAAGNVSKRTVALYVDNIDNTTVYCVLHANGDVNENGKEFGTGEAKFNATEIFQVQEGELIFGEFETGNSTTNTGVNTVTGLTFFGDPDDKHALAFMSSTNSHGHYFPLHDSQGNVVQDADGTPLDKVNNQPYYADKDAGAAKWLAIGLSGNLDRNSDGKEDMNDIDNAIWKAQIVTMAKYFAGLGHDGAMGFTRRRGEGDLYSNLSFVSDLMPMVDKVVDGVLPTGGKFQNYQRYVPNMVAAVDEIVFFKITVTLERPTIWKTAEDSNKNVYTVTDKDGNPYGAISYTDAWLIDEALEYDKTDYMDAYFYTKDLDQKDGAAWDGEIAEDLRVNRQEITDALNEAWKPGEEVRVLSYYLVYKIQDKDIPEFYIENTVDLAYQYSSSYSSGALAESARAEADITVIGEAMDNVVIDFGQTIVYAGLTNRHLKGVYVDGTNDDPNITQCKAMANYGTVTVTREPVMENGVHKTDGNGYPEYTYTVTYTPTAILQAPDVVRLYGIGKEGKEKIINGFIVYPATTVYYEEGFAFPVINSPSQAGEWGMTTGSWDLEAAETATVEQTFEKLGKPGKGSQGEDIIVSDKQNPYGFDPVYNTAAPNGSFAETHTLGDKTRFTFTGDGIQIFANCTKDSGYVSVEVREAVAPYKIVRLAMVNTKVLAGQTGATEGQTGNMDGLPVVSLLNLQNMPHGQYIVTITKIMDSKPVYIDGIRIFNTVEPQEDASPFTIDLEDQPSFYELRDAVLHAVGANAEQGVEGSTEDYIGKVTQQIYDAVSGESAVIIDPSVQYANSGTLQDLLDNGPKNELFLYPGQTLAVNVRTNRVLQVGLKAPQGATTADIRVSGGAYELRSTPAVSSPVDMFHYLVDKPVQEAVTYTVSIQNMGSEILAVTLLKICDDPQAAFEQLTREDIEKVLTAQNAPITILSQPVDAEVKMGERFNVEVVAMGEGLQYRWYYRNAGSAVWQKSSVKDNTYDDVMTKARAGREIYCVITDAAGNSVTTNTVKLIAKPETTLMILRQPTDAAAKVGERYCVEVIAVGEGLQYRWFFRNQGSNVWNQSGVTDNTYDDVMTLARAGREVYCVITDSAGHSVATDTVKLVALPRITLEILQQPADAEARMGEKFCVEVIAMGEGLRYQWYYRNAGSEEFVASGVRDNTYDDVMTSARAGREVYCVITDSYGNSVTTGSAKLVLIPNETLEILQQPVNGEAKLGEKFCVEVFAKGDGLRYTWYFRNAGSETWHKSGVTDNTYDDVMTMARAGREVYCVITDACGNRVTTDTVKLIAVPQETLEILQQPVDAQAMMGEMYLVEVVAKGEGLRYTWYFRNLGSSVWYKSGVTDNTYDDVMTKARAGRQVYCVITDAAGNSVTTETVTLVCIKDPQMVIAD